MPKLMSEEWALIGVINPSSQSAGEQLSAAIDMANFHEVMMEVMVGALGASATVDATIKQSDTSGGTYAAISGKSITQLTKAGSDDNKQVHVNLRSNEMTDGKRYIKASITVGTAACLTAVEVWGRPRYSPAHLVDLSSVDEII